MLNSNPETVSTDFENCDLLFFDELSLERTLDVIEKTNAVGVIAFAGGQIPNNLAPKLDQQKVKVLGTDPKDIDRAENRETFSKLCESLGIDQPEWKSFSHLEEAEAFAKKVGFPVLVRPSKVLSGAAMAVAHNLVELESFLSRAAKISSDAPVVISKFEIGAREIEIDAVASNGEILVFAISEHVENAGVHSGDATVVLPPQKTFLETIRRIKKIAKTLAKNLEITGPFNIQFLAKNNAIKVIELNLRSSRSFPFVSKVLGINFIEISAAAAEEKMINEKIFEEFWQKNLSKTKKLKISKNKTKKDFFEEKILPGLKLPKIKKNKTIRKKFRTLELEHVGVKAPQFSFSRLDGADPVLSVEMASTGEVGCFGENFEEAFLKSMISVGFKIPKKGVLFSIGNLKNKIDLLPAAEFFVEKKMKIFATPGTADFLLENGIPVEKLLKISAEKNPAQAKILQKIMAQEIDLVINIPKNFAHEENTDGYKIRRAAIDNNISLITNCQVAQAICRAIEKFPEIKNLPIHFSAEYFSKK